MLGAVLAVDTGFVSIHTLIGHPFPPAEHQFLNESPNALRLLTGNSNQSEPIRLAYFLDLVSYQFIISNIINNFKITEKYRIE